MAQRKIIWSPKAKSDLFKILTFYYKRNGTKTYSKKLNSAIRLSIKKLMKHSDIGVQSDVQNVRNLIEENYNIFYEITQECIVIITIWDSRQNPDNLYIKD
jgi:plasmid stabilization system protein ParE